MEGRGDGLSQSDMARMTVLMMQKKISVITKDGIKLNGRLYWHERLASRRHEVLVRYDEHLSPGEAIVYDMDGNYICTALDRKSHHIAYGLHPAAGILGTDEQKTDFENAILIKGQQRKQSEAPIRAMLEKIILPQARAHVNEIQTAAREPSRKITEKPAPKPTALEIASFEEAKAQALAKINAEPQYTPSDLKRWRDSQERYAYLFKTKYEREVQLVEADNAWMEAYEGTNEYQNYLKNRYSALREMYERKRGMAEKIA